MSKPMIIDIAERHIKKGYKNNGELICALCDNRKTHPVNDHLVGPCGCGNYYSVSCARQIYVGVSLDLYLYPERKVTAIMCKTCNKTFSIKRSFSYKKILYWLSWLTYLIIEFYMGIISLRILSPSKEQLKEMYQESNYCDSFGTIMGLGAFSEVSIFIMKIFILLGLTSEYASKYKGTIEALYKISVEIVTPLLITKLIIWTSVVLIGKYYYGIDIITYNFFTYSITLFILIIIGIVSSISWCLYNCLKELCTKDNLKSCLTEETYDYYV